ncbi:FAD/NAD-P-binding domain-containing protein [Lentinula raphanica]|nr:FAD/NAD-P-binding domain-containing protein [Lentinula raphanica]
MSSKKSDSEKTTIVIVGGGIGGLALLNALSTSIDPEKHTVVLVDARPSHMHLISALRLVVSDADDLLNKAVHPYGNHTFRNKFAGNGSFVHGSVTSVKFGDDGKGGELILDNGEIVAYDVLVLATGSSWPRPLGFPTESRSAIEEHIMARRAEFSAAKDILLVGGGSLGLELAGELKDIFPSKPVSIIHRERLLLNDTYPDKYRIAVQKAVEDRGVTVLLGDAITASNSSDVSTSQVPEGGFVTEQGKKLNPDLVVPTWGNRPNTSYLPSDLLSSTGHVKILPTFQLPAYPNVFAFGDIIDWKEQKGAAKAAFFHTPKVAKNVMLYLDLSERASTCDLMASRRSAKYTGCMEMIMITNGKSRGLGYFNILWGIIVGSWLITLLKAKTLMIGRIPSQTGFTPK